MAAVMSNKPTVLTSDAMARQLGVSDNDLEPLLVQFMIDRLPWMEELRKTVLLAEEYEQVLLRSTSLGGDMRDDFVEMLMYRIDDDALLRFGEAMKLGSNIGWIANPFGSTMWRVVSGDMNMQVRYDVYRSVHTFPPEIKDIILGHIGFKAVSVNDKTGYMHRRELDDNYTFGVWCMDQKPTPQYDLDMWVSSKDMTLQESKMLVAQIGQGTGFKKSHLQKGRRYEFTDRFGRTKTRFGHDDVGCTTMVPRQRQRTLFPEMDIAFSNPTEFFNGSQLSDTASSLYMTCDDSGDVVIRSRVKMDVLLVLMESAFKLNRISQSWVAKRSRTTSGRRRMNKLRNLWTIIDARFPVTRPVSVHTCEDLLEELEKRGVDTRDYLRVLGG